MQIDSVLVPPSLQSAVAGFTPQTPPPAPDLPVCPYEPFLAGLCRRFCNQSNASLSAVWLSSCAAAGLLTLGQLFLQVFLWTAVARAGTARTTHASTAGCTSARAAVNLE